MKKRQRKAHVVQSRNALLCIIVAIIFFGKQWMAFRGHRESSLDLFLNAGNFLEALKFLSSYDSTIHNHLEKAKEFPLTSSTKVGEKRGAKDRGSEISFLNTLRGFTCYSAYQLKPIWYARLIKGVTISR